MTSSTRRTALTIAWIVAAALIVGGLTLILIGLLSSTGSASFGWFAYQPLSQATFYGSPALFESITPAGAALFALGALIAAFLTGHHWGRRSGS